MALVPYVPRRSSYSTAMMPQPIQYPYPQQRMMMPYNNRSMMSTSNRRYRRRSKWLTTNTRTNPIYPRPEVKFQDYPIGSPFAPTPIPNDGTAAFCINPLSQGTGALSNRIGQQVATKSCYYQIVFNLGTVAVPIALRHILYWDRQFNGVASPVIGDLLANTSFLTSPLNLANRNRFVILSDDRLTLSPQGEMIRILDGFRVINQLSTYPDETFNPLTGALCVFVCSDEPTGDQTPTMYGIWRTRYMDN